MLGLQPPVLLVTGDSDDLCSVPHLQKVCMSMKSADIRLVVMKVILHTSGAPTPKMHLFHSAA